MIHLPINAIIPALREALRRGGNLVLEAPPGAGKTTRVPPALLEEGCGEVLVLEPRRLAARLAARRVAEERGEPLGQMVGYQVRFEQVAGPATRLRFLTEGVLTRRLLSDPQLRGVGWVVLDEFHERHLEGDLALALLKRLQQTRRPDLRLVVMSATLDCGPIADYLGGCPVLRCEGRLHGLEIRYTPSSAAPLEEQVAAALEQVLGAEGDVLVFLPGAAEIRRAQRACEALAARRNLLVVPLHGDLSAEEQDRAVGPAAQRKVILSTNVAESSVTIEGVRVVIDSGLARVASDSPRTGLPAVEVARVSRASATQRAGRAGRVAPGRVVRLYPEEDFLRRPAHDAPEITRRELCGPCLELHAAGVGDPYELEWLEKPPQGAVAAAEELLRRLGALDAAGTLTGTGRRMAALPLHPRLARMVLEADARGSGEEGCAAAALLSAGARLPGEARRQEASDVFVLFEQRREGRIQRLEEQIRRLARPRTRLGPDEALLIAILAAFPDRVARRRRGADLQMAGGGAAQLAANSAVDRASFLVALDIEERPERGAPLVRLASGIEPGWLLDLYPERIREISRVEWNRQAERVEAYSALRYDEIPIEENREGTPAEPAASELLAEQALAAGIERFVEAAEWDALRERLAFAAAFGALPPPRDEHVRAALAGLTRGLRSFAELRAALGKGAWQSALFGQLSPGAARVLEEVAPARLRLPNGRMAKVGYAAGQPPWVASRLQDFFGMPEAPKLARGQVTVVVHLLAPNQRPVQMTQDLAGFWERLYPQVRRELMRRYPRHAWPENPYNPEKR